MGCCHGASISRHGFEKKLGVARTVEARYHKGVSDQQQNGVIYIKVANKVGKSELKNGGVCDLLYPKTTTRRGRVIDKGDTSPTLMAATLNLYKVEMNDEM